MKILTGWKEIARHLHQGVRTVQRWELIGLPIHRVRHTLRGPVVAFEEELDAWAEASHVRVYDVVNKLQAEVSVLKAEVASLKRTIRGRRHPAKHLRPDIKARV